MEGVGVITTLTQIIAVTALADCHDRSVPLSSHKPGNSDSYGQPGWDEAVQAFPILAFPGFSGGVIRRKRDWVIPPVSLSENDRGPFPKAVVQMRSSVARDNAVTYRITGPGTEEPPEGVFTVDRRSGILYVTRPLDREKRKEYSLRAHAVAEGRGPVEEPMELIIRVMDQNDNRPYCSLTPIRANVSELALPDFLVGRVMAEDRDDPSTENAIIRYRLVRQEPSLPNAEMFSISPISGTIHINSIGLDRESYSHYKLVVEAADQEGRGLATTCMAIITVTDCNDHPPKFSHRSYSASIEENNVGGVVVRLPVTDLDEPLTVTSATKYIIVNGNEEGFFKISTGPNRMEGIITTDKGLDFERTASLSLLVAVVNEVPFAVPLPTSTATVTVSVEDLNEAPIFLPAQKWVSVSEDLAVGSVITQYTAKDPDTARHQSIRYVLQEDAAGWLEVSRDSGQVRVRRPLDRESTHVRNGRYHAIIIAHDDDPDPCTGTGTLVIELGDVNDHAPVLEQRVVRFCSSDPEPVSLIISDRDGPENAGPFTVELQGTAQANWTITSNSSMSSVLSPRWPLPLGPYMLVLRVYDTHLLFQDSSLQAQVCQCSGVVSTCPHPHLSPRAPPPAHPLLAALGAALALLLLLLLLLILIRRRGHGKREELLQEEEVRDSVCCYNEEGGGEEDQEYDLSQLYQVLGCSPAVLCAAVFPLSPPAVYRPHRRESEEISTFITDNLCAADNDPTAPPHDSLLVFDYMGAGSEAGSLSSLQSSSSGWDQDFEQLSQWGPCFRRLADMYGGGEECSDTETLPGKTEWV